MQRQPRSEDARKFDEKWIGPLAVLSFLVLWEVVPRTGLVNELFTSRPSLLVSAFVQTLATSQFRTDVAISLWEFSAGFIPAVGFGVATGFVLGVSRLSRDLATPPLMALYVIPSTILLPLVIMWVGIGYPSKIAVAFLAALFPIILNIIAGMEDVDQKLVRVGRVFGATPFMLWWRIYLPSTLPYLFVGLRLAVGRSLLAVIAAEIFVSQAGLGYRIAMFGNAMRIDYLLVHAIVVTMFGFLLVRAIQFLEARVMYWKQN